MGQLQGPNGKLDVQQCDSYVNANLQDLNDLGSDLLVTIEYLQAADRNIDILLLSKYFWRDII